MFNKIVFGTITVLLLSVSARADECSAALTGLFPAAQAVKLCKTFPLSALPDGSALITTTSLKPIILRSSGTVSSQLSVISTAIDKTTLIYGDGTATRGHLEIRGATTDGDDDGYIIIGPGGGNSLENGSAIVLYGNETTGGNEGDLKLDCGNVADAVVEVITPQTVGNPSSYKVRWYWQHGTGNFYNDPTSGGDLVLQKSGTTTSVQEATPSTACMGTATPNGVTNVTVTTTCAVTGSRIFYSRAGAITNMGAVSTTTVPAGVSFTFASAGASDTLASSVVWWIIKEAA